MNKKMKCGDQEVMQLKEAMKPGSMAHLAISPIAKEMLCVMFLRLKESQRDR